MATLEKIRNRAGVLVTVVIGLALVAFILGDILGSGPSLFTNRQFEIAEIAGKSISFENFQRKVDQLTEIYMLNTGQSALDAETNEQILEEAWQLMLREIIMDEEYGRIGLEVSSEELFDMVQGANIHPIVRQLFTDPSTGAFDQAAVIRFLRTMDQDPTGQQRAYWIYVEREIVRERAMAKYNNLLRKGLYVPDLQARRSWEEDNKSVDFEFIVQRYNTVHDSLVNVTESDIRRYYRQNRSSFRQTASRDLEYVAFDIVPSEEDDLLAREWIENMKDEFTEVQEVRQFINLNSDIPYDQRNYRYEELPETIADFLWNAEPGEIYGPYYEDGVYMLSRLLEINFLPDSVRARHILIQPGEQLDFEQARNRADSLLEAARGGEDFEIMALQYSDDPGSRFEGGNLGWFTDGMMIPEFNNAVFSATRGEYFMVETQHGFHIVQVTDRARETKKVRYATLAREVTPSSATFQRIFTRASRFAGQYNTYDKFVEGAQEEGMALRMANNVQIGDRSIPGLEPARELVRWAFEARENSISPIKEIDDRFVIAALTKVRQEGYQPLEEVAGEIESILVRERKGEIIASRLREKISEDTHLEELAAGLNTQVEEARNILFSSFSVPGAGIEPRLIATALNSEPNTISGPVQGENGVYVLRVTAVNIPEDKDIEAVRRNLANSKRARVNFDAFEALREQANVKDNRHQFF